MNLQYDPEADAVYVRLSDKKVVSMRTVSKNRNAAALNIAADKSIVGVELLGVSRGIDLKGLPDSQALSELLIKEGFTLRGPSGSEEEIVKDFLDTVVLGFMGRDIRVAYVGKAKFLAALGLLDHTEIVGGLVLGDLDADPEEKFEAFLPYLGECYTDLSARLKDTRGKGLYALRSTLIYSYGRRPMVVIRLESERAGRCGIELDAAGGWDFCVSQYARDFRHGVERLHVELNDRPDLVSNVIRVLGRTSKA